MAEHVTSETIRRYHAGELAPDELLALDSHRSECAACRAQLLRPEAATAAGRRVGADLRAAARDAGHLSHDDVAAYVDETLAGSAHGQAQQHLAACRMCADAVTDLRAFRAELSTYAPQAYAPEAAVGLADRLRASWARGAARASLQLVGASALGAALVFAAAVRPLQTQVAGLRAQRDQRLFAIAPNSPGPGGSPTTGLSLPNERLTAELHDLRAQHAAAQEKIAGLERQAAGQPLLLLDPSGQPLLPPDGGTLPAAGGPAVRPRPAEQYVRLRLALGILYLEDGRLDDAERELRWVAAAAAAAPAGRQAAALLAQVDGARK